MRKRRILIFCLLFTVMFLLSCTPKQKPNISSNTGTNKLEKTVTKLSQDIDKIYTSQQKYLDTNMDLSPPSIKKITETKQTAETAKPAKATQTKSEGAEGTGGGSSGGSKEGQSKSGGSQGSQAGGKTSEKKPSQKPPTANISPAQSALVEATKNINGIHKDWSNLEAELVKNGVSMITIDSFSNDLNTLTTEIRSGEPIRIAYYSNVLYKYIPEFMQSAQSKNPIGTYLVIFYLRNVYINAYQGNWAQCALVLKDLNSEWSSLRMNIKNQNAMNKIDFAIKDLSKAVEKKDKSLVKIKSEILYQDLKPLIKESSGGSNSGGSSTGSEGSSGGSNTEGGGSSGGSSS